MLTLERLKQVLDYNPKTGIFTWKIMLSSRAGVGKRAGCESLHCSTLYRKIRIDGILYYEHRLAWLYMTGEWPDPECDHKDLDGVNNVWTNLRQAEKVENLCNKRRSKVNTSGAKGVSLRKDTQKWTARIHIRKKQINLGCFDTKEEAASAYAEASSKYHGEFGRTE